MDRNKVIEGLEYCRNQPGCWSESSECPWIAECREDINSLKDAAIALLKEQEEIVPFIDIDEAKCPICKVKLTRQELLGEDVLFEDFFDYCPRCGRKVKWQ